MSVLEAELVREAYLKRLEDLLLPGNWSWKTDGGFSWIPYRLQHDLTVEELRSDDGETHWCCRSVFTLATGIENFGSAMAEANSLNQRGIGGSVFLDLDSAELKVLTGVCLSPATWFEVELFENLITRLVGLVEVIAPKVAERCGVEPMIAEHPSLGARDQPDQFIGEADLITFVPEASTGLWWSEREIQSFRSSMQYFAELVGGDDAQSSPPVGTYDPGLTSADNLRYSVDLTHLDFPTRLSLRESDHHDFGRGIEILLSTPISFETDRDTDQAANESWDSLLAVNLMNYMTYKVPDSAISSFVAGGWSSWNGQVSLATYLPPEPMRILQFHCANSPMSQSGMENVGATLAVLTWRQVERLTELVMLLSSSSLEAKPEVLDTYLWDGVNHNAHLSWVYLDDTAATEALIDGLPTNSVFEPIELGREYWAIPHHHVPVRMGIFNPSGMSVGSIEVSINYSLQRALLVERLRHPFSPELRLFAVLDLEGFGNLGLHVADVLRRLGWSNLDWVEIEAMTDDDHQTIIGGLWDFIITRDLDIEREARAFEQCLFNPWERVAHGFEPDPMITLRENPLVSLLGLLTSAANLDAHYAYLRSAWEGALQFRADFDNPEKADKVREREATLIEVRLGVRQRSPSQVES